MFGELAELRVRKQELLIQSDANRRALAAQLEPVQDALGWVDTGRSALRQFRSLGVWLALGAGVLAARRGKSSGATGRLARWWNYLRTGLFVWKLIQDRRKPAKENSSRPSQ